MVFSKRAPQVEVYIDGRLNTDAHVLSATMTSGGRQLPQAEIVIEPTLARKGRGRLLNRGMAEFDQSEVEIVVRGQKRTVCHWGKILATNGSLERTGDSISYISRIDEHHFGDPLVNSYFWAPSPRIVQALHLPTIFNPDFDGRSVKNMAVRRSPVGFRLFLHHESTQTESAIRWQDSGTPLYWTLPEAVGYLCWTLNSNQTYIENPSFRDLTTALPIDQDLIRNHECRLGAYLPELLDDLLEPFGFSWTVDFLSRGHRKIRIFQRGKGPISFLQLQSPGSVVDMNKSTLEAISVKADVSDEAFNRVEVLGDFILIESTFELQRAWANQYDNRVVTDLQKNCAAWLTTPALERVWRDWVLNESADYNTVRRPNMAPYNFDLLFGRQGYINRRRKFEPCLTLNSDGSPKGHTSGVFIEYFDYLGGKQWRPIDELSSEGRTVRVLDRECGIRFDGLEIPAEIRAQGENARIRVTATVRSDKRLQVVNSAPNSLLGEFKKEVLDVSSRFKFRERSRFSRFTLPTKDTADDNRAAVILSAQVLSAWNAATITGPATISGIDYDFREFIGVVVGGIDGRAVTFQSSGGAPRYPSIMQITIRPQDQVTELSLDSVRANVNYFERHTDLRSGKRRRVR